MITLMNVGYLELPRQLTLKRGVLCRYNCETAIADDSECRNTVFNDGAIKKTGN